MPYNKETAFKNQKEFLKSQCNTGHPNIDRIARQRLKEMEEIERKQKEFDERIRKFNAEWNAKRKMKIVPKLGGKR